MLTCNLQGGLGNQMFQIFATLATSFHSSLPYYFIPHPNLGKRNTYWTNVFSTLPKTNYRPSYVPNSMRVSEEMFPHLWQRYTQIREGHSRVAYDSSRALVLDGYFQDEEYFKAYKEQIFDLLKIRQQQALIHRMYYREFDFEHAIALHFRRDDYKQLREYYHLLPTEYYANALHAFLDNHKRKKKENHDPTAEGDSSPPAHRWKAYIFYQDVDHADIVAIVNELEKDETLHREVEFLFVSCHIVDWQQMLLMSLCPAQIIANSTFSWWSAYLNIENTKPEEERKEIYYPAKWYEFKYAHLDTSGLQVQGWQKIDF